MFYVKIGFQFVLVNVDIPQGFAELPVKTFFREDSDNTIVVSTVSNMEQKNVLVYIDSIFS